MMPTGRDSFRYRASLIWLEGGKMDVRRTLSIAIKPSLILR